MTVALHDLASSVGTIAKAIRVSMERELARDGIPDQERERKVDEAIGNARQQEEQLTKLRSYRRPAPLPPDADPPEPQAKQMPDPRVDPSMPVERAHLDRTRTRGGSVFLKGAG